MQPFEGYVIMKSLRRQNPNSLSQRLTLSPNHNL
jgi:hypothetical protein